MKYIWKCSIILYTIKVILLFLNLFTGNEFSKSLNFFTIEYLFNLVFVTVSVVLIILTIIYKNNKVGYYFYNYDEYKFSYVYAVVSICIVSELLISLVYRRYFSGVETYLDLKMYIFLKLRTLFFLAVSGGTYIICKKDYFKKLKNTPEENIKSRKRFIGILIPIVIIFISIASFKVISTQNGIHTIFNFTFINVEQECYVYDVGKEEVIGTAIINVSGTINNTEKFKGTITVKGYEIECVDELGDNVLKVSEDKKNFKITVKETASNKVLNIYSSLDEVEFD